MSIKQSDVIFSTGRPKDNTDPGFLIKGLRLRWVSGGVEARRAPRFWKTLKLSMIPKELHKQFREKLSSFIDGDTIRRRDLILSYAPEEVCAAKRKELKQNQRANESIFRANQRSSEHGMVKTTSDTAATVEKSASQQFT